MRIYAFNPEHDLAVANGSENYTPPPLAVRLRNDLSFLPLWLSELPLNEILRSVQTQILPDNIRIFYENMKIVENAEYLPWGWDAYIRKRLINSGARIEDLPSSSYLDLVRKLSHRRTSILLLNELKKRAILPNNINYPLEIKDINEVVAFAQSHKDCFVKAPWSGSGKGVYRGYYPDTIDFRNWCSGVIKKQGSIICEPAYAKKMDFALEFISNGSIVSFAGYSIFSTDKHNSFGGSYVASESQLAAKLPDLTKMINALEEILPSILTGYSGYFGIDMMLLENNTIHPCVELNLRNTMGVVAMVLGNRYLCNDSHGCFNVTFHKSEENISRWIADYSNRFPLVINNGRISSGFLSLCPVSKETRYSCTLLVEKNCK